MDAFYRFGKRERANCTAFEGLWFRGSGGLSLSIGILSLLLSVLLIIGPVMSWQFKQEKYTTFI